MYTITIDKDNGDPTKLLNTGGKIRNWSPIDSELVKEWQNDENPEVSFAVVERDMLEQMDFYEGQYIRVPDKGYAAVFLLRGEVIRRVSLDGFKETRKDEIKKMAAQVIARVPLENDFPVIDEVEEEKYGYWYRNRSRSTNLPVFQNALTGTDVIVHPGGELKVFSLSNGRGYSQYDVLLSDSTKEERKEWMRNNPYL